MKRRLLRTGLPGLLLLALLAGGGWAAWHHLSWSPAWHIHLLAWRSFALYWQGREVALLTDSQDLSQLRRGIDWYHPDEGEGMMGRCGEGDRFCARIVDVCGRSVDLELPVDDCPHVNLLRGNYGFYAPRLLQTIGALIPDQAANQNAWLTKPERDQLLGIIRGWRSSHSQEGS